MTVTGQARASLQAAGRGPALLEVPLKFTVWAEVTVTPLGPAPRCRSLSHGPAPGVRRTSRGLKMFCKKKNLSTGPFASGPGPILN